MIKRLTSASQLPKDHWLHAVDPRLSLRKAKAMARDPSTVFYHIKRAPKFGPLMFEERGWIVSDGPEAINLPEPEEEPESAPQEPEGRTGAAPIEIRQLELIPL